MTSVVWGAARLVLDEGEAPSREWTFDATTVLLGRAAGDPEYPAYVEATVGRTVTDGDGLRFCKRQRTLVGFSISLPYPLTVADSLDHLTELPCVEGLLRWVDGAAPDPTCERATLAPGVWQWHCSDGVPKRRWRIAPDLEALIDDRDRVCGLRLASPLARLPGRPCDPSLDALALEAYALHFKYEWDDDEWTPRDAARVGALTTQLERIDGAAPIVELLSWCA